MKAAAFISSLFLCFLFIGSQLPATASTFTPGLTQATEKAQQTGDSHTAVHSTVCKYANVNELTVSHFDVDDEEDDHFDRKAVFPAKYFLSFYYAFILQPGAGEQPLTYKPIHFSSSPKYITQRVLRI